jgi:hypothetical protein
MTAPACTGPALERVVEVLAVRAVPFTNAAPRVERARVADARRVASDSQLSSAART